MEEAVEVVIGATRRAFRPTITDPVTGQVIPITGGTVRLQGTSEDLPDDPIDVAGTIYDGPNGLAQWLSVGTMVDPADLDEKTSALYTFRVKYTDAASAFDWTEQFQWNFVLPPDIS